MADQNGLNILASSSVQSGHGVAHRRRSRYGSGAILKTTGFERAAKAISSRVGKPADMEAMDQTVDRVVTRVYRPNHQGR
jgi:hypothetical protein